MSLYGTGTTAKTELLINGTWTDFSTRPRYAQKVGIKRGKANEQGDVTAQSCNATLNNRDGQLSNRNPLSPYFGLLPRNTQMRVTAGGGDTYLKVPYTDQTAAARNVMAAANTALNITGDIDVRIDVQPYSWRTGISTVTPTQQGMTFGSKGTVDGNLAWVFYLLGDGTLKFRWYPSGTAASALSGTSTVPVPANSGRISIRATLKVNNGASGNTVTFYTSTSVTGTWTQLGSPIVQSGTTSIFNSTGRVVFAGGRDGYATFFSDVPSFGGKMYRAQIYNGIAGTLVADMDATSRSVGDFTWSDGLASPNTWTLTTDVYTRITSDRVRFVGELSSLPQAWDLTGKEATVPVTASGAIRRLTQGASPISSPMFRNFNQYSPAGYWALEDSSGATQAASAVAAAPAATATNVTFGVVDAGLPGAASVAQFNDATSRLQFSAPKVSSTGTISFVFYVKLPSLPSASHVLATLFTSGSAAQCRIAISATTWDLTILDNRGNSLATSSVGLTGIDPSQGWVGYNLLLQTSGSDMTYSIRWDAISAFGGGVGPTTITGGTVGIPTGGYINTVTDSAFFTAKVSSWFMSTTNLDLTNDNFRKASSAWKGETAAARLVRLAQEQAQSIEVTGIMADSEPMGPQLIDTFMNNVYDCARTDGGILGECRDLLSLSYRTRTSLERRADVTLDYAQSQLSDVPLPTEDDQAFTNDVTASRSGGSSARAQRLEGQTSIFPPPTGVGPYATAPTAVNTYTDARLSSVAGWMMLVGSWDDSRYPIIPIGLHRSEVVNNASLLAQIMALELGDTATMVNLPAYVPPDAIPELIQGYTETLDQFTWSISYNATPAGPYNVPVPGSADIPLRLDASTHTISNTMTTTSTSVTLVTPAGLPVWVDSATYPAEFPIPIKIAGEVMSLTAVTGTSSPQTGTVTRSVNGVVKTHNANELVRLATPFYLGR